MFDTEARTLDTKKISPEQSRIRFIKQYFLTVYSLKLDVEKVLGHLEMLIFLALVQ